MRDDTLYSIGHDRKYLEEHAALHAHLSPTKKATRWEIAGGIIGGIILVLAILGMCLCMLGMAGGYINFIH